MDKLIIQTEVLNVIEDPMFRGIKCLIVKSNHAFSPFVNPEHLLLNKQILKRRIKLGRFLGHDVKCEMKILADYYGEVADY